MMRLSTRDLFAILAFFAVISWCAGQVGYTNPLFWISVGISMGLGVLFIRWSGYRDCRVAALIAVLLASGFCLTPFGSLAVFHSAGFLLLATVMSAIAKIRLTRARYGIAMSCVAAALVLTCSYGNADFNRLVALRKLYPIESFDQRLVYEPTQPATAGPVVIAASLDAALTEDEQAFNRRGWRLSHLQMVHDREYEHFVRAAGFGIMRMGRPREATLAMPSLRNIEFSNPTHAEPSDLWNRWRNHIAIEPNDPVEQAHHASRYDFLDAEGYGEVIRRRTAVVGFVPHAFHQHPLEYSKERPTWSIDRIELVSLLKFDAPRVYVLDHLPRMDQLSSDSAPTRPLTAFEDSALRNLRSAEDIVIAEDGNQIEMLGSLRAATACLECHNVRRGELLGAFSYQLTQIDAAPATGDEATVADDSRVESVQAAK